MHTLDKSSLQGVLPQDGAKPRSSEIVRHNDHTAVQFDRNLDSATAEVPAKFQSKSRG